MRCERCGEQATMRGECKCTKILDAHYAGLANAYPHNINWASAAQAQDPSESEKFQQICAMQNAAYMRPEEPVSMPARAARWYSGAFLRHYGMPLVPGLLIALGYFALIAFTVWCAVKR